MKSTELSCEEFISLLASDAPAPGGGGGAALVGALGTALGNMVGALTVGKPRFVDVEAELIELNTAAKALQTRFIKLVEKDAQAFVPLSKAYRLPMVTEEEATHKAQVMEECLVTCSEVPLNIMRTCAEALEVLERLEQIGTPLAISDVGCGAVSLRGALLAADLNVRVNTKLMQNRSVADALNAEAEALLAKYGLLADEVYRKVQERFN